MEPLIYFNSVQFSLFSAQTSNPIFLEWKLMYLVEKVFHPVYSVHPRVSVAAVLALRKGVSDAVVSDTVNSSSKYLQAKDLDI